MGTNDANCDEIDTCIANIAVCKHMGIAYTNAHANTKRKQIVQNVMKNKHIVHGMVVISSDRSSYSDSVLVEIRGHQLFEILSISANICSFSMIL